MDHGNHDPPWRTRSVQDHLGPRSDIFLMTPLLKELDISGNLKEVGIVTGPFKSNVPGRYVLNQGCLEVRQGEEAPSRDIIQSLHHINSEREGPMEKEGKQEEVGGP